MPASMPVASIRSIASSPAHAVVMTICVPPSAGSVRATRTIAVDVSGLGLPSASAKPDSNSRLWGGSIARTRQRPPYRFPSGPVMTYATVPPGARSCSVSVAGYIGGPHQRSSWRGSLQTCQTRAIGASKRAVMVRVLASASLITLITGIPVLFRSDAGCCSVLDPEAQVGHIGSFEEAGQFEVDGTCEVSEQLSPAAQEHRDQSELELVEEARTQARLRQLGAVDEHVPVACGLLGLPHRALDSVGHVRDERRRWRGRLAPGGHEDRDAVMVPVVVAGVVERAAADEHGTRGHQFV